ncbi:unnamed protein product [Sphenostylis stenocarpa]|uniref:Uncharacterized protein n=1 Tax=Sphenostylis stenocarpa TaxID=92480 RepID=A0AA86SI74_9FABA|nr:unnamed protein product [Sphenostylis stenocarpa]
MEHGITFNLIQSSWWERVLQLQHPEKKRRHKMNEDDDDKSHKAMECYKID